MTGFTSGFSSESSSHSQNRRSSPRVVVSSFPLLFSSAGLDFRITTLELNMRTPFFRHILQLMGFMSCSKHNILNVLQRFVLYFLNRFYITEEESAVGFHLYFTEFAGIVILLVSQAEVLLVKVGAFFRC